MRLWSLEQFWRQPTACRYLADLSRQTKLNYTQPQFWRNTNDLDVVRFLKLFTELPLDEIDKLGELQGAALNEAKKVHFSDRMRFSFT